MLFFTEVEVLNIKKYSQISVEEKSRLQNGGNSKFLAYVGKVSDKYHCGLAGQYRFEIALGLSEYDYESDSSTNYASPNKSFIALPEQKKRLNKILEIQGVQQDLEWLQIQYQILTRDLKKKIDRNTYINMIDKTAKGIIQKQQKHQEEQKIKYNQSSVFNSFSALLQYKI